MMVMACRISLFDSERVGEGLCLGQAYTAWCKSCGEGDLYRGYCPSCWEKWEAPGRGPPFWWSEPCSHTVEPYEKRISKECTLCLPWTTSIFCVFFPSDQTAADQSLMSKPFLHWAQMKTGKPNDRQHVNMLLCSNANVWASLHPKFSGTFLTRLPMVPTIDGVSRGVGLARSCSRRRRVQDRQLTKLTELQIPTCDLHPQLLPIKKGHQWIKTLQLVLVK